MDHPNECTNRNIIMMNKQVSSYKMKNHLLSLSRNVFKAVNLFDSLLSQTFVILSELREIKQLLFEQRPPGEDLRVLSVAEAAERLQVKPKTLRHWVAQGKLTFIQIGQENYYKASEVL